MVHHNGRPDIFKGPATKYSREELIEIISNSDTPVFVCVDENDYVMGHGFCKFYEAMGLVPQKVGMELIL